MPKHTKSTPNKQEATPQRRLAPTQSLDRRIPSTVYKGRIIKKRIERNQTSNVKRKFFKELKKDGQQLPEKRISEHKARSNPYEKLMRERDAVRQEKEKEIEEREKERSEVERRKLKYLNSRRDERKVFVARTKKGQPALAGQIGCLLQKIKKSL